MFPYFKNILLITRKLNAASIIKSDTTGVHKLLNCHGKRPFCICGSEYKNYSESVNRFNGVHVTLEQKYEGPDAFEKDLLELFAQWSTDNRRSVFLTIPIHESHLIPVAAKHGFKFHHARNDHAVLSLWLNKETKSKLPNFANHTVGVAGACFDQETNKLLLVQDKGRYQKWWKFPGGFAEMHENIGDCAVRETFEETGIESRFESILSFREQHGTLFNQSDFYIIARLHPLTTKINQCPDEIEDSRWIDINEVLEMSDCTPFVKLCCNLLLRGVENGFEDVDITATETPSWIVPTKTFLLYRRSTKT